MTDLIVAMTQTGLLIVAALTTLAFALVMAVGYVTARPQVDRRRLRSALAAGRTTPDGSQGPCPERSSRVCAGC